MKVAIGAYVSPNVCWITVGVLLSLDAASPLLSPALSDSLLLSLLNWSLKLRVVVPLKLGEREKLTVSMRVCSFSAALRSAAHTLLFIFSALRSAVTRLESARQTLATASMLWLNAAPTRASVVARLNTMRTSSTALRASIAPQ